MACCGAAVKAVCCLVVLLATAWTVHKTCFTSVLAGDAVAVWELDGSVQVVEGPRLVWIVGRHVSKLRRYTATPKRAPTM